MDQNQNPLGPKDIKPIATGKLRKRSVFREVVASLVSEDAPKVLEYVGKDVMAPELKNVLVDCAHGIVDVIFVGRGRSVSKKSKSTFAYNSIYDGEPKAKNNIYAKRSGFAPEDIVIEFDPNLPKNEARREAHRKAVEIVETLNADLEQYDYAQLADLFSLAGITGNGWTDRKWGWKDLTGMRIYEERNAYVISVPKCIELDI